MGKKGKQTLLATDEKEDSKKTDNSEEQEKDLPNGSPVVKADDNPDDDDDDDDGHDDESSEEDDDLILEGAIVRNPDVSDSDDTSEEEDDEEEESSEKPESSAAKRPAITIRNDNATKKKIKKTTNPEPEIVQVEFTFNDMDENYFHGLKTMLTSTSSIYAPHSSALADLMIDNVSIGTVVSTEGDKEEGIVYGFATVLNITWYQDKPAIQGLKKFCMDHCPADRKSELEVVLSGKTKRPAGFFLHGRMVNMPLEIVQVLHEQLILDIDWAVKNAEGGEEERKSLDFGVFVRIAPSYRVAQSVAYKFFDDEIFAQHADLTFEVELPKTPGMEETPYCSVIVLTKTGHRAAMQDIVQMVSGGGMNAAADR